MKNEDVESSVGAEASESEILGIFRSTEALLEGHFQLSSGLHSRQYLQCARVLQDPSIAERLGRALAEHFKDLGVSVVVAPAIGGILVAHEVARALGVRALFTEREGGVMTLRRGFRLSPGERVLVVEDVVTTGGSTRETIEAVLRAGGVVAGAGSLVDRSGGAADVGVSRAALLTLEVPTYQPGTCPMCQEGSAAVKPGSRQPKA
ncbi:MAG TPA: orotate phosphoribosyltransferase [Blastocatellia bacterium]|nr:orotate phosphoribosyltransferase [Blastocatellia bacterium]